MIVLGTGTSVRACSRASRVSPVSTPHHSILTNPTPQAAKDFLTYVNRP